MAEIQMTTLVDDLTGKPLEAEDAHRIHFSVEGKQYRLDVDQAGADKFYAALDEFTENASKVTAGGRRGAATPARRGGSSSGLDLTKVRDWAREKGIKVAERGRISAEVLDAYRAAH